MRYHVLVFIDIATIRMYMLSRSIDGLCLQLCGSGCAGLGVMDCHSKNIHAVKIHRWIGSFRLGLGVCVTCLFLARASKR